MSHGPTVPSSRSVLADQLGAYESSLLPERSRVDPNIAQRTGRRMIWGWGLQDLFLVVLFVLQKIKHLLEETVAHFVFGPRRPSWGLSMTIITSFMRDVGRHSSLADISFIRALVGVTSWMPFPPSALVTPVSFRVRYRQLRGLLREFDECEQGGPKFSGSGAKARELTAEWIVDRRMWTKWQKRWKGQKKDKSDKILGGGERVVLYLHGGAYYVANAQSHRLITIQVSRACRARVFALNYRLAPETRFPGPLHDAASAYFRLIDLGVSPSSIILVGDSAGGGLCTGLLLYLRDNEYPLPSAACLLSPWLDLTMSCESWDTNHPFDVVPRPEAGDPLNPILCYLGAEGIKQGFLTHPYASPLFGTLKGLPPLLIQSGEAEVLRDEIELFAYKAKLAGVEVDHEVFEDCVHVFQTFPHLEQTTLAFQAMRSFVSRLSTDTGHPSTSTRDPERASNNEPDAKRPASDPLEKQAEGDASLARSSDSSSPPSRRHIHHHPAHAVIPPSYATSTFLISSTFPSSSHAQPPPPPKRPLIMASSRSYRNPRATPPRMRSRALSHPEIVEIADKYAQDSIDS